MAFPTCQHIKPSGKRCGSPALHDQEFCYYHTQMEQSLPTLRNMYFAYNPKAAPGVWPLLDFPTPALEDAAAIQIGFMQALHGIANGNLDVRKAKLMLSALHGASANLQRLEACLSQGLSKVPRKPAASVKAAGKSVRRLPRPSQTKAGTGHPEPGREAVSASV